MMPVRTVPDAIRVGRHTLSFEHRTLIMGILNVTPDSFSDGGRIQSPSDALQAAKQMMDDGADLVDVGGESTRPGAAVVDVAEELRRVVPVVEALASANIPVSVDTRNAEVAKQALQAGAGLINDVSAMTHDPAMIDVAAKSGAAIVLMHMRGTPATMQQGAIHYDHVVEDVARFLEDRRQSVIARGVEKTQVLLDPGMGFGKTVAHNLALMVGMERLARSGCAVVWGPSRKSSLGAILGGAPVDKRVMGTVASCVLAAHHGAHMVRVHDVKEVREALAVVDAARGDFLQ